MPYDVAHGDHAASSSYSNHKGSERYVPITKIQQSILEAMQLPSYQKAVSQEVSDKQQRGTRTNSRPKKYSRPCDGCAFKKVRCSGTVPCTRCVLNKVECTNVRIRKKCGPKPKEIIVNHQTTSELQCSSRSSSTSNSLLNLNQSRLGISSEPLLSSSNSNSNSNPNPNSNSNPTQEVYSTRDHHFISKTSSSSKTTRDFFNDSSFAKSDRYAPPQRIAELEGFTDFSDSRQPGNSNFSSRPTNSGPSGKSNHTLLTLDDQLPTLHVFQTWYYGVWPVVSVPDLISKMESMYIEEPMSYDTSVIYALALSICAAISRQVSFLSPKNAQIVNWNNKIDPSVFANECLRIIHIYNHRMKPSTETLLASFFLYVYYINDKDGVSPAILYLREALAIAQLMKLHEPKTYEGKTTIESHRLSKIYYLLLITERYTNIQEGIPVVLDALIPLPSLYDEEYPSLLSGFTELAKIFLAPNRKFFDRMTVSVNPEQLSSDIILRDIMGEEFNDANNNWIVEIQNRLNLVKIQHPTSSIQAANIILSKYWMMSLVWHASHSSGMISPSGDDNNCLSVAHPHKIAHDFLTSISELPVFAFESNGPGVVVKLLEIANGLADSAAEVIHFKAPISFPVSSIYDSIRAVFGMVSKFKSNFTLPNGLYQKIETILNSRQIIPNPSVQHNGAYITEIKEGEDICSGADMMQSTSVSESSRDCKPDSTGIESELQTKNGYLALDEIVSRNSSSEYLRALFQSSLNSQVTSPTVGGSPFGYYFNGEGTTTNPENTDE